MVSRKQRKRENLTVGPGSVEWKAGHKTINCSELRVRWQGLFALTGTLYLIVREQCFFFKLENRYKNQRKVIQESTVFSKITLKNGVVVESGARHAAAAGG